MTEFVNEATLEEQQEEVTVLQSIFEDDLQILQGEDGQGNICFNLTVKVNLPFERIDLEAFVPIPGHEENLGERPTRLGYIGMEPGTYHREAEEEQATKSDTQEEACTPASVNFIKTENGNISKSSPKSISGRTKPVFSRSLSRRHWLVRADIQYLTPIYVTCSFPPLYPTECPPEFSLSCLWLTRSQIKELQEKLTSLWTENPHLPIVFTWADWLQNYAYEYLGLGSHLVLNTDEECKELMHSKRFSTKLQTALLTIFEYDLEMQRQAFRRNTHLCEICFDERNGSEFHYLDECRHFFCNDCFKAHCELHVEGGTVLNLLCPNHDCKMMIPPEILQDVLDPEKLEKWGRLLLSRTLDVMGDVVYCPRCNVAVVIDEDETPDLATVQIASLHFAQNVVTNGITGNHVLMMNRTPMKKTVQNTKTQHQETRTKRIKKEPLGKPPQYLLEENRDCRKKNNAELMKKYICKKRT